MTQGGPRKAGRGWSELRGDLKEVRDLAQWLRDLIDAAGLTLRDLQAALPFGRDTISRGINGEVRPEWGFVRDIVACCSAKQDPRVRERRLVEAQTRWKLADPATATRLPRPTRPAPSSARTGDIERERSLSDQLTAALNRCLDLEKSLGESQNMVLTLRVMTDKLHEQVDALTRERNDLRSRLTAGDGVEEIQRQLTTASDQYRRATAALERARAEREEAERLRVVAENVAQHLREELEQVRSQQETSEPHLPVPATVQHALRPHQADDIDRALETADQFLTRQAAELALIADDLEGSAPAREKVIPGMVVVGQPGLSGTDNAPASRPASDNPAQPDTATAPSGPANSAGGGIDGHSAPRLIVPGDAAYYDHLAGGFDAGNGIVRLVDLAVRRPEPLVPQGGHYLTDPVVPEARRLIAAGAVETAEAILEAALEARDGEAGVLLADLARARGEHRRRRALIDQVTELILHKGPRWRAARTALLNHYRGEEADEEIERFLRAQAEAGGSDDKADLARYLLGKGEREKAMAVLERAAVDGAVRLLEEVPQGEIAQQAEHWLERGLYYRYEAREWKQARRWLEKAANAGNARATDELLTLFQQMGGPEGTQDTTASASASVRPEAVDPDEAQEWLERGLYYRDKVRNREEAITWLKRAANAGNARAADELRTLLQMRNST